MSLLDFIIKGAETGFSLLANVSEARTASTTGEFNARQARINADRSRQDAEFIRRQTELRVDAVRRIASQTEGTQRAGYGASGVSISSGSAVDVFKDTAMQAALDVEIIRMEGERSIKSAEMQAAGYEQQADIEKWAGKRRATGSYLSAGASLLEGGADLYDMWKKR